MGRNPRASVFVDHVTLHMNDTLTVYFHQGDPFNPNMVQLEMRVNEHGEIELFCDENMKVQPFSLWTLMPIDRA